LATAQKFRSRTDLNHKNRNYTSDVSSSSLPVGLGPFASFGYGWGGGGEAVKNFAVHTVHRKCWLNVCGKNWVQKIRSKQINKFWQGQTVMDFLIFRYLMFVMLSNNNDDNDDMTLFNDR
jgi:hypothetical protein